MPAYTYECPKCGYTEEIIHTIRVCETLKFLCACGTNLVRIIGAPRTQVNGMNAAGGYSDSIGDIQKTMGRPIENSDLDKPVSILGKIND